MMSLEIQQYEAELLVRALKKVADDETSTTRDKVNAVNLIDYIEGTESGDRP